MKDLLLTVCGKESKIIVTTRNTSVASVMGTTPAHNLECLSEEDSLSLFLKYAFGDEELAEQFPKLKEIGKQIVQKCKGVPLALKTLGSLLSLKTDEGEWIHVRDNEIWKLKQEHSSAIMFALRLSYAIMSPQLKQCFAYCSLVPKNLRTERSYMIDVWMAFGIIQSSTDKTELEDIGKLHFKELCTRSFFQYLDDAEDTCDMYQAFEMHDLIHDLATSIIQHEHFTVHSSNRTVPIQNARHLIIVLNDSHGQSILTILEKLKKVQSVFLAHEMDEEPNINESFLSTCISRFIYLRLFNLSFISFEVLPSSIGTLKHLRYLSLDGNKKIRKLPNSICKLQSLQTLHLNYCSELEELPRDVSKLINLQKLTITTKQTCFPENGIGPLRSLRLLTLHGCRNLKSLPHDIRFCTTLRTLIIEECDQLDLVSRPDKVLQLSLQSLIIRDLPQMTALPEWLQGAAHTLQLWFIVDCPKFVASPEWLPNLTSLQTVVIGGCPKLLSLPHGMQKLTSLTLLRIFKCNALEEQCKCKTGEDWPKIAHVPNLSISPARDDD